MRELTHTAMLQDERRLTELRVLLNEPRLVEVERFQHGGRTWFRLHVACGCYECNPLPARHAPALRMVPAGDFRKPHRLSRRVGRAMSDVEARVVVRLLHEYANAKGQS